jgi:hypothetical protein
MYLKSATMDADLRLTTRHLSDDEQSAQLLGFVTGLLIVVALFMSVMISALAIKAIFDHWCSCFPSVDRGNVALKAGFCGLTIEERGQVVQHLFREKIVYQQDANSTDLERNHAEPTLTKKGNSNDRLAEGEEEGVATNEEGETTRTAVDGSENERLCCICLAGYQPGDSLLRGKRCGHTFHHHCSMEWLNVPRDHCPYCRQELFTPAQYRQAAIEVLGEARVAILRRARHCPFTSTVRSPPTAPAEALGSQSTLHGAPLEPRTTEATSESELEEP